MKKLIEKLRLWLIGRLNAVPMDEHAELCREGIALLHRLERHDIALLRGENWESIALLHRLERQEAEQKRITDCFQHAVREICRKSETTYYNWCCDICCMRGENCNANGWCERFWPEKVTDND